jgi:hypothetical protein
VRITRNPKLIAGSSILLTASAFMFVVYGTFDRVPLPFFVVYFASLLSSGILTFLGRTEEKNLAIHNTH